MWGKDKSLPDPTKQDQDDGTSPEKRTSVIKRRSNAYASQKPLPDPLKMNDAASSAPSAAETALPGYASAIGTSAPQFKTKFASMSMHMSDRLRFLHFPSSDIAVVQQTIKSSWPRGIQDVRTYGNSYEVKLYGYPWLGSGQEAIFARRLMYRLFATLHSLGWVLTLSTDISRKRDDKDTLIFRYQDPRPVECQWCALAFSMQDRIRFIDAPIEVQARIVDRLVSARKVQTHRPHTVPGSYEIKMLGTPWRAVGEEAVTSRELLLVLLEELEAEGWTVYASIDQKATHSDNTSETDTWHCCKPLNWVRGAPVYHN